MLATSSERVSNNKISSVLRLTIIFTVAMVFVVVYVSLFLRVIVANESVKTYSKIFINQVSPPRSKGIYDVDKLLPQDLLSFLENIETTNSITKNLTSGKIVIIDGKVLSDPYNMIDKKFNLSNPPSIYKFNGIYFIFVKFIVFENSILTIGGPSLEYTAFIETFDYVTVMMIIFGSLFGLFISYVLAVRTLRPVIHISRQISKIDVESLEQRIPQQETLEFQILSDRLNSMLQRLQSGYETQKQFVSDVSHELRTPLTTVSGYISMLKRWGLKDETILNESIQSLEKSTEYLKDLIEKLLLLSKPDYNMEMEIIDISLVVKDVTDIYDKNSVQINTYGQPFEVLTSEKYLSIVLKVLIDNALKFSEKKQVDISFGDNRLSIRDYGIGIEKEKLEKIFDRFYKGSFSRNEGGHGLGLSIAKKISEKLGIDIEVESEVNSGSTFTLIFKEKKEESDDTQI